MGLMVVIAVVFPCIAIFSAQTLVRYCLFKTDESSICDIFRDVGNEYRSNIREATAFLKAQFFLGQSLLLNMFLTNVLKYWVRRPRPNFFAFCNYKGYRNALETNNFAAYLSKTAVTTMGKVADCTSTESDIHEAQLSWPSGHSSSGMTGLLATALIFTVCINAAVDMGQLKNFWLTKTMKVFAIVIPVLGAFLVGATRVKDYWHNFDDVLSGLFIGMFCTLACFYNMYISPNINERKNA
jgi:membrane-associated phospholipid phosphatase